MGNVGRDWWRRFSQDQHVPFYLNPKVWIDSRNCFEVSLEFRSEILGRIDLRREDRLQMFKLDLHRFIAADEWRAIG